MATTTSAANVDLVKSLGADVVIDYKKEDFEKLLNGYDVVLNSLGKDALEKSFEVLKPVESSFPSPVRLMSRSPGRTGRTGSCNKSCAF